MDTAQRTYIVWRPEASGPSLLCFHHLSWQSINRGIEHWFIDYDLGQEWKCLKQLGSGMSYDQFHHHHRLTPLAHSVFNFSKALAGVSWGAMKEETDLFYAHAFPPPPNPIAHYGYLAFNLIKRVQENLYKGVDKQLSCKSWRTKEINVFLAGNKISGKCREATHQMMCNTSPVNWSWVCFLMLVTRLGVWAPSSPHPPHLYSDFCYKCLGWNVDPLSAKAWSFHSNCNPEYLFRHKHSSSWSEILRRLGGRIMPGHHFGDNAFFL